MVAFRLYFNFIKFKYKTKIKLKLFFEIKTLIFLYTAITSYLESRVSSFSACLSRRSFVDESATLGFLKHSHYLLRHDGADDIERDPSGSRWMGYPNCYHSPVS